MHCGDKPFKRFHLTLIFAAIVFVIMLFTMAVVGVLMLIIMRLGGFQEKEHFGFPLGFFAVASLIMGAIFSLPISRRPLAPIRELMNAADRIAKGDYTVRIDLKGPEGIRQLGEKFNHMAEELGSVEMLRSDFINNFSHEFKTPIVSIRGFAKMLKRDDLSNEERNEYLDIIISESDRLSELSTNVLNLSKLEQQTILTDKSLLNVSEQIRQVIALLDVKIESKRLQIDLDCSEVYLEVSDELLKQLWINLLDNAVKFTPHDGKITIRIVPEAGYYRFIISNESESILSPDITSHLFDKFYQGDTSHTERGNGLGLTIAKRIVELHDGAINAQTNQDKILSIIVQLPQSQ